MDHISLDYVLIGFPTPLFKVTFYLFHILMKATQEYMITYQEVLLGKGVDVAKGLAKYFEKVAH